MLAHCEDLPSAFSDLGHDIASDETRVENADKAHVEQVRYKCPIEVRLNVLTIFKELMDTEKGERQHAVYQENQAASCVEFQRPPVNLLFELSDSLIPHQVVYLEAPDRDQNSKLNQLGAKVGVVVPGEVLHLNGENRDPQVVNNEEAHHPNLRKHGPSIPLQVRVETLTQAHFALFAFKR